MNALKWCETETSLLSQDACGVQRFHHQEVCAVCKGPVLYPAKNEEIYSYGIVSHINNFSCQVTLLLKRKLQHVGHMWVTSGLFTVGQMAMGQQVRPTFNPDS